MGIIRNSDLFSASSHDDILRGLIKVGKARNTNGRMVWFWGDTSEFSPQDVGGCPYMPHSACTMHPIHNASRRCMLRLPLETTSLRDNTFSAFL